MAEPIPARLVRAISEVAGLYHRLVVLVGPSNSGKTTAMRDLSITTNNKLINVNLELAKALLDMTGRQRSLQTPKLLEQIAAQAGPVALFDNTEVLFDVQIKQDPLRLLQGLARNRTVITTWNGNVKNGKLLYAEPGHPEFKCYDLDDLVYICTADDEDLISIDKHTSKVGINEIR